MEKLGLQQRIWRVIYPMLIYLLMSTFFGLLISIIYALTLVGSEQYAAEIMDFNRILDISAQYMLDNTLFVSLCGYIAALAVFIPIWFKTKVRYPRWNGGGFSIPVALCAAGAAIGLNVVFSVIITITGLAELFPGHDVVIDAVTGGSMPLQIIAVGLITPVAEELCFRGVTLSRMSGTKIWIALAIQAVLFGILHMNILQSTYTALLGVFLGFLTIRYRNIIYAIIAHVAFNLCSIVLGAVKSELFVTILSVVIVLLAIVSVAGLVKCKKPEPYTPPEDAAVSVEG